MSWRRGCSQRQGGDWDLEKVQEAMNSRARIIGR